MIPNCQTTHYLQSPPLPTGPPERGGRDEQHDFGRLYIVRLWGPLNHVIFKLSAGGVPPTDPTATANVGGPGAV